MENVTQTLPLGSQMNQVVYHRLSLLKLYFGEVALKGLVGLPDGPLRPNWAPALLRFTQV